MALKHGNKNYYQVLLDPHRSKLNEINLKKDLLEKAKKERMKGTAWVRRAAYNQLQREFSSAEYKIAEAKDELLWRESVQRRIDGRKDNSTK